MKRGLPRVTQPWSQGLTVLRFAEQRTAATQLQSCCGEAALARPPRVPGRKNNLNLHVKVLPFGLSSHFPKVGQTSSHFPKVGQTRVGGFSIKTAIGSLRQNHPHTSGLAEFLVGSPALLMILPIPLTSPLA